MPPLTHLPAGLNAKVKEKRHYKIFFVDMKDEDGIQQVYAAAEALQAGIGLTKLEATGKLMFELRWTDGKDAHV